MGKVRGSSLKAMIDDAYLSFETMSSQAEVNPLADIGYDDIYHAVVFDHLQCNNQEEVDIICQKDYAKLNYENVKQILLE